MIENHRSDNEGSLHKVSNGNASWMETNFKRTRNEMQGSTNATSVSGIHPSDDAEGLTSSIIQGLVISNDAYKPCSPNAEGSVSSSDNVWHASHLYFSSSYLEDGDIRNGNEESKQRESFDFAEQNMTSGVLPATCEIDTNIHGDHCEKQLVHSQGVQSPVGSKHHLLSSNSVWSSEDLYSGYPTSISAAGNQEALSSLSDLCGDYDSHFRSLNYGRWCYYDYFLSASVPPMSSPLVSHFQSNISWDVVRQSAQFRQNEISPINANGVVAGQAYYPMNPPKLHGASFGMDEMPKARVTGTYFPNPNVNHYRDRSLTSRGRNPAPARSPLNNGYAITSPETSSPERSSHELAQVLSVNQDGKKSRTSELRHSSSEKMLSCSASGPMHQPFRVVEFGSIGPLPLDSASPRSSKQHNVGSPRAQNSIASRPQIGMPRPKSAISMDQNRVLARSFHLKNEEDFPPLSI